MLTTKAGKQSTGHWAVYIKHPLWVSGRSTRPALHTQRLCPGVLIKTDRPSLQEKAYSKALKVDASFALLLDVALSENSAWKPAQRKLQGSRILNAYGHMLAERHAYLIIVHIPDETSSSVSLQPAISGLLAVLQASESMKETHAIMCCQVDELIRQVWTMHADLNTARSWLV